VYRALPSRPNRSTRYRIGCRLWLQIVALLALISASGCQTSDRADRSGSSPARSISAAEVEAMAHVRFPPATLLLSTSYEGFQDWRMTAAFRMPRSALPEFLNASGFPEPTVGLRAVRNADHPPSDTWKPDAATQVAGVNQSNQPVNGVYRKVMFDIEQSETVTGYLMAFTT
jgi:hypothetical protein